MPLTRSQIFILGAVLLVILLVAGMFPGIKKKDLLPPSLTLTIWGVDDQSFWNDSLSAYKTLRPTINVEYREFNEASLEKNLIDALAAGQGPDIVMFHH